MEKKKMNIEVRADTEGKSSEIMSIVARTDKENPKPEDLEALKTFFDKEPWAALQIGNMRRNVFNTVLSAAVGKSAFGREATERYVKKMKTEMGYETSSFVEQMLIDEIIMCWLRLQVMEQSHLSSTTGQHSMKEGEYCERRLHLTHKRYLQSIETLAKVRKMIAITQAKGAEMFKNLVEAKDKQDSSKL